MTTDESWRWSRWYSALSALESVDLPRCVIACPLPQHVELHAFSDAIDSGQTCAVYLRATHDDQTHVSFLLSKSCVCPRKTASIPGLELKAAEMSVLVVSSIRAELDVNVNSVMYLDGCHICSAVYTKF